MPRSRVLSRPAAAAALTSLTLGGAAALVAPVASGAKAKPVKVRVEVVGKPPAGKVLLNRTVTLSSRPVARFGGSCTGESAVGALQLATKGAWGGTWDAEYSDYEVTKIAGLSLPFNSKSAANWYWSVLVGGKEASAGVCDVKLKRGQTLTFKAACYGKRCPKTPVKKKVGALVGDAGRHS
jgi:mRNA-degrading endonuclease toxin of MazEF toxin-antitoxin module